MTLYIDGVETEIAPNIINELLRGYADWRKLLGPEKVTNGGFTGAATGWTLGAGWTYNANAVDRDGAGTATLTQDVSAVAKELYKVVFTLTAYTDGSVTPSIGGVSGDAVSSAITSTQYILATGTGVLTFTPTADATFTLDNVSVKKVGYVSVDGITLWIDDRGATAGKGALHMMTEDGTRYVFGDRLGIGTLNPTDSVEMLGNLVINIGAKALTLMHGITAARTVTFPDASLTVAGQNIDNAFSVDQSFLSISFKTEGLFTTLNADSDYVIGKAKDNGQGLVEIWRMVCAGDPYFRIGRDDTGVALNAVTDMLVLQAGGGTGNEAANFGLGLAINLGNAASEVEKRGYLNWVLTTATNGSEATRLDIGLMSGGALLLPISVRGGAGLDINSGFGLLLANGSINFDTTATGLIAVAADTGSIDFIARKATGGVTNAIVAKIQNALGAGDANAGYLEGTRGIALPEMTAPAAIANKAYLFAQDNGAGKTQLMVQMPTGAAIQIAIEA